MTAETLDAIITKYNHFVSPTEDELAVVAQYIPLELLKPPMTFVTWLNVLSFAKKERQDRINAVAHRISGIGVINGPSLKKDADLLKWLQTQEAVKARVAENAGAILGGNAVGWDAQAQFERAMINKVNKF